ncbi:MAG: UDP-N-acetylmuramate--L-alanine ligase [Pirellulales bacterium]|nr:UDP-N-acetylmuramate--L-alanine ligase [Pirellulales bacterium]
MALLTRSSSPRWSLLPRPDCHQAHLVGVAGSGMRALADVLLRRGWRVSGSDLAPAGLEALVASGLQLVAGHPADAISTTTHLVVHSAAIDADNPERRRAREIGVPCVSYPQLLGHWSETHATTAIAGTHGKSTTTAMAAAIFAHAGLDPTVVGGGATLGAATGGRAGRHDRLMIEACEFQRNFLHLRPRTAVLLNVEWDHVDCYATPADVAAAFSQLVAAVPHDGLVIANADDRSTLDVAASARARLVTFGQGPWARWWAADLRHAAGRYTFRLLHRGSPEATIRLAVRGRHQVQNALAAAALAAESGASLQAIREALEGFPGVQRRLEWLPNWRGVTRIDDYAHHPTAVAATLAAVREACPGRRIVAVFEPHQRSRTERLLDDFARSLHNADSVWVAPVYCAREPETDARLSIAAELGWRIWARGGDAVVCRELSEIAPALATRLSPGDVLVTMGAGDVRKIQDELA